MGFRGERPRGANWLDRFLFFLLLLVLLVLLWGGVVSFIILWERLGR